MFSIKEEVPDPQTFLALRSGAGMRSRSKEGIEKGLGKELYSVVLRLKETLEPVGMGRVVGDGGTIFVICDMAVLENWQRKGGRHYDHGSTNGIHSTRSPTKVICQPDGRYRRVL